jgi:hypothetical protein
MGRIKSARVLHDFRRGKYFNPASISGEKNSQIKK